MHVLVFPIKILRPTLRTMQLDSISFMLIFNTLNFANHLKCCIYKYSSMWENITEINHLKNLNCQHLHSSFGPKDTHSALIVILGSFLCQVNFIFSSFHTQ